MTQYRNRCWKAFRIANILQVCDQGKKTVLIWCVLFVSGKNGNESIESECVCKHVSWIWFVVCDNGQQCYMFTRKMVSSSVICCTTYATICPRQCILTQNINKNLRCYREPKERQEKKEWKQIQNLYLQSKVHVNYSNVSILYESQCCHSASNGDNVRMNQKLWH